MAKYDDLNTPAVAVVGLLGAILTVATILAVFVLYQRVDSRLEYERNTSQTPVEVSTLVANQRITLTETRWLNQEAGTVRIPITRAMELVVAEIASKQDEAKEPSDGQ
ncbi:MAG TPA: hypothetical protein VE890_03165 [Thermoguttaceae bacterium]|nr:hypothetical protein [Thermoguttaceae bacterium]